jgi:hypothetical protein
MGGEEYQPFLLHKGIPEGILEFHVSKFDIDFSWCVVGWKELPNKCTLSEHFYKENVLKQNFFHNSIQY